MNQYINKPTSAFIAVSWVALISGITAYIIGLWNANMLLNEKGYYLILILYGLFAAVSLQKIVRDKLEGMHVTAIYFGLCWASIIICIALIAIGLWNAPLQLSEKGFYIMAFLLSLFGAVAVQGYNKTVIQLAQMAARALDPRVILGILAYLPLINKMRDNVIKLGLAEEKLYAAMNKFAKIGGRTAAGRRNPWYQIIQFHAYKVIDRKQKWFHIPVNGMVAMTDQIPEKSLPKVPSWIYQLTAEPTATK